MLRRARPRDAVLGEEFGRVGDGPRCWVIDPIDGTKNFVRGVPVWATLIGLMDGAKVVVGVVSAPALGRRWWATTGTGAWTGRSLTKATRCRVSDVARLEDASFSYSGVGGWAERGMLDGFLGLTRAAWRTRAYGDFWSHMLVAEGAVDFSAEPEVKLWDLAALQVIVEEAGRHVHRPRRPGHPGGRQRGVQQRAAAPGGARPADRQARRVGLQPGLIGRPTSSELGRRTSPKGPCPGGGLRGCWNSVPVTRAQARYVRTRRHRRPG